MIDSEIDPSSFADGVMVGTSERYHCIGLLVYPLRAATPNCFSENEQQQ